MRLSAVLATACLLACLDATASDLSPAQAAAFAFAPTVEQASRPAVHIKASRSWMTTTGSAPYEASVDEYPVTSEGQTVGLVSTFGYTETPVQASRPVVFLFNGGPGASSWSLHMEGFGPVRYDAAKDTFEDNPDALLDVADLVFIDPLGTGDSAPFTGTKPETAWGAEGDARATLSVMHQWLVDHGRQDAPVFVVGESYGTARAAAMLHFASAEEAAPVKGVALLSLALGGLPDPAKQAAGRLPSMAATAWYHHKGSADLPSGMEAYQHAVSAQAPSSADVKQWIGVAGDDAKGAATRVPEASSFRKALLADSGKIVGSLDTRMTADHSLDALQPPYSDPGMTLGKRPSTLMARYLVSLGYRSPVAYRMLNLAINTSWNYGGSPDEWPFAGYVAEGMRAHPAVKLFTAGGIYDLSTPAYEGILTLRQVGVPADRWEAHIYPSGHTIGEDAAQRPVLASDLRRFITGK